MKNILLLFCFIILQYGVSAQIRNSGMYRQMNTNNKPAKSLEMPALVINKMAQLIFYDAGDVIKALKVREAPKKLTLISAIDNYNNKIIEIKAFNQETLSSAKTLLQNKRATSKRIGDPLIMKEARIKLKEILKPIRQKVQEQKIILNRSFEKILNIKEYNKWLKFQKNMMSNKPKHSPAFSEKRKGLKQGQRRQHF